MQSSNLRLLQHASQDIRITLGPRAYSRYSRITTKQVEQATSRARHLQGCCFLQTIRRVGRRGCDWRFKPLHRATRPNVPYAQAKEVIGDDQLRSMARARGTPYSWTNPDFMSPGSSQHHLSSHPTSCPPQHTKTHPMSLVPATFPVTISGQSQSSSSPCFF